MVYEDGEVERTIHINHAKPAKFTAPDLPKPVPPVEEPRPPLGYLSAGFTHKTSRPRAPPVNRNEAARPPPAVSAVPAVPAVPAAPLPAAAPVNQNPEPAPPHRRSPRLNPELGHAHAIKSQPPARQPHSAPKSRTANRLEMARTYLLTVSYCDAPKSADRFPRSADGSFEASEGFPTPVTSPLRPPTPPVAQIRQNSGRKYVNKEVCMYICTLKPLKNRKEKEELKCKHSGSTNCRNHSDVIVSGIIVASPDSDVTIRNLEVNKPIARKHYAPRKQSLVHSKGILKSLLRVCNRTFTFIALILAIIISVLGGLFNIRLPERKSTIVTSSEPLVASRFLDFSVFSNLRESAAAIIRIREGLCSGMHKRMSLNNNKQLIRCMKVLQNTIICEETICTNRSLLILIMQLTRWQRLQERFWRENVWLHIYSRSRTSGLSEYII